MSMVRKPGAFAKQIAMRAAGRIAVMLNAWFGRRAGRSVGILTYHRIARRPEGLPPPLHNVTPDRFRQQIAGLAARGFHIWPLRRVLDCGRRRQPIPRRTAVLTFDDGYASVYHNAWPVLRELQVPATVFVSTAFLDSGDPFPFDQWGTDHAAQAPAEAFAPLTTGQCRELLQTGLIDLGAHTHSHQDFRGRPEAFREDLQRSIQVLRQRFHIAFPTFAFPFGSPQLGFAGDELVAAARSTDVCCGLTTECVTADPATDPFRWGRFNVFPWDTAGTLAAKLDGWYSWAPKLRKRLARSTHRHAARRRRPDSHRVEDATAICQGGR